MPTHKAHDIVTTNHPTIKSIKLIQVCASPDGPRYEGWLNRGLAASDYFTLYHKPATGSFKGGWLANLSKVWTKRITAAELAALLGH